MAATDEPAGPEGAGSTTLAPARPAPDLDDGDHVRFLDFGGAFLDQDGSLSPLVMYDYVHPTLFGYEIETAWVLPPVVALLEQK